MLEVASTQVEDNVQPVVTVVGLLRASVFVNVCPLLSRRVIVQRLLPAATRLLSKKAPPVPAEMRPVAVPVPPLLMKAFLLVMPAHGPPTAQMLEPQSIPP